MKKILFILVVLICLASGNLKAQDRQKADTTGKTLFKKHKPYIIVLNDGTEYVGEILEDDGREMLINVKKKGKIFIPKYVIKSIELVTPENYKNDEYLYTNAFPRYYMLGSNALPFKKREISANLYYFLSGSVHYNVNENVSLGLTSTWWGSPIALSAKTSFMLSEKNYVGVDVNAGTIIYSAPGSFIGKISAKYTHGDENKNFTLGAGLMSFSYNPSKSNSNGYSDIAYYMGASGASRLSQRTMFVGEFWVFPRTNFGLAGMGIRSIKKESSSFVFGIYGLFQLSNAPYSQSNNYPNKNNLHLYYRNSNLPLIPIPYLGYSFKL
ncbi:MAG: hypothetical protein ACJ76F_07235 [Bacteroidia bacterium]